MSQAANKLRLARRKISEKSILDFAKFYFPLYTKEEFSYFHDEICKMLMNMSVGGYKKRTEDARLAIAAPRGHAKSTIITFFYVMWSICYEKDKFILIFSATANQAQKLLSNVKNALQNNRKLQKDFPEIFTKREDVQSKWTQEEIITENGIGVAAFGWGQEGIRGTKHLEERPTLIILDDVDSDKNTYSTKSRENVYHLFSTAVLNTGAKIFNTVAVGTILHPDSLLAKLTRKSDRPDFESKIYQAVEKFSERKDLWQTWGNILFKRGGETYQEEYGLKAADRYFNDHKQEMLEGTRVLWPEMEDYYTLMKIKEIEGSFRFDTEKQNTPTTAEECRYKPDNFHYWDDDGTSEEKLLASFRDDYIFIAACDPSVGVMKKGSDHSAIITLAKHKGKLYVIDADITQRPQEQLVKAIINYYKIRRPMEKFIIEGNLFPELLSKYITEHAQLENVSIPLKEIRNTSNKQLRIFGMEAYITTGIILFSRKHTVLLDQLKYFPRDDHDDGPDALEMALRGAEIGNVGFEILTETLDDKGRDSNHPDTGIPSVIDDTRDDDDDPPPKWFSGSK